MQYLKKHIELWPEQIEAIEVLTKKKRMILADSTGLGKTMSILSSFITLYAENPNRRLVVLSSKSAMTA